MKSTAIALMTAAALVVACASNAFAQAGPAPAPAGGDAKKPEAPPPAAAPKSGLDALKAKAAKGPTLIVFDLAAEKGVEKSTTNMLTELVIDDITKLKVFNVMGQKDIDKMLSWEQNKQLQGCTETSCLVQIAGAMGASYYIEGSVGAVGSQYIITLKLIDAEKIAVLARGTRRVPKNEDQMLDATIQLVKEIFAGIQKPAPAEAKAAPAPPAETKAEPRADAGAEPKTEARAELKTSVPYETAARTEAPPARRGAFWRNTCLIGGSALLAVGVVSTLLAKNEADSYSSNVTTYNADTRDQAVGKVTAFNGLAVVGYVTGVAAVGTGIVLWLTGVSPSREPAPKAVSVEPGEDNTVKVVWRW